MAVTQQTGPTYPKVVTTSEGVDVVWVHRMVCWWLNNLAVSLKRCSESNAFIKPFHLIFLPHIFTYKRSLSFSDETRFYLMGDTPVNLSYS